MTSPAPSPAPRTVTLSLVSHTNAGKTTLARTLLKRDIGEVRDEAHVTDVSEAHPMITSAAGHVLQLWDTPGFGDSVRLRDRLGQRTGGNPIGWFLGEVWDRWTNRPLWCSQQAMRNVRDEADLVLYLVNAAEPPAATGYVAPEMDILDWLGKPIVVLLNHTGRDATRARADALAWRERLAPFPLVRDVMDLDAFSRCWVQEDRLLERLTDLVPPELQPAARELTRAWRARNRDVFDRSMVVLTTHLLRTARDREALPHEGGLRQLLATVGSRPNRAQQAASAALAGRLEADNTATLEALLRLHALEPGEARVIQRDLREAFVARRGLDETSTTVLGGLLSGALTGLTADFLAGGLTFGGGAVAGAILGASGAKLLARGYNLVRGQAEDGLRWAEPMLITFARLALLRYLAVAHHGRGRGHFAEGEDPASWIAALDAAFMPHEAELREALAGTDADALRTCLTRIAEKTLARLHPAPTRTPS
jgi:hypothetical protein